jgi:predicted transcriptional regulator
MERLRTKGFLRREKEGGVFRYSPNQVNNEAMKLAVGEFIRRSLGGSLAPFVSYLAESAELSPSEVAQLRQLVESLPDVPLGGAELVTLDDSAGERG